jgi:hypothetical protein
MSLVDEERVMAEYNLTELEKNRLDKSVSHYLVYLHAMYEKAKNNSTLISRAVTISMIPDLDLLKAALAGLSEELPCSFLDYMQKVVLRSLQGVSHQGGVFAFDAELSDCLIKSLSQTPGDKGGESIHRAQFQKAIAPLVDEYHGLIKPSKERPCAGDEVDHEFLEDELKVAFHRDMEEQGFYEKYHASYQEALTIYNQGQKAKLYSEGLESEAKADFSLAAEKAYATLSGVLAKIARHFHQARDEKEKSSYVYLFMCAYNVFFSGINEVLQEWVRVTYSFLSPTDPTDREFIEMAAPFAREMERVIHNIRGTVDEAEFDLLRMLGKAASPLARECTDADGKYYGLFYSFYVLFLNAVLSSKVTLCDASIKGHADHVKGVLKEKAQAPAVVAENSYTESRLALQGVLERVNASICALNESRSRPFSCLLVLLQLTIVGLFWVKKIKSKHESIMDRRRVEWATCQNQAKVFLARKDVKPKDKANRLVPGLRKRLLATNSAYVLHRGLFSKKKTRSQCVIERVLHEAGTDIVL